MEGYYLLVSLAATLLILYVFHGLKDKLVMFILLGGTVVFAFLSYLTGIPTLMIVSPSIALLISLVARNARDVKTSSD